MKLVLLTAICLVAAPAMEIVATPVMETVAAGEVESGEVKIYQGYWRFVREDFKKRHPFLPGFMVNQALATRLYLGDDFIQYRSPDSMIGEPRPIVQVETVKEDHFRFQRREKGRLVAFELYRENGEWFYREGDLFYQLIKDTPEDHQRWKHGP